MKLSPSFKYVLILLGALAVAILGLTWFLSTHERVEHEIEVGLAGEARRNTFLAAERFLEVLGVQVESVESLHGRDRLPGANGTIFIPVQRSTLGRDRYAQLRTWVESGGHLVVLGRLGFEKLGGVRRDELLGPLGVEIDDPEATEDDGSDESTADEPHAEAKEEACADAEASTEVEGPDADPYAEAEAEEEEERRDMEWDDELGRFVFEASGATVGDVKLPGHLEPLRITREYDETPWEMRDSHGRAVWAVPGAEKFRLLQYAVGDGLITALSGTAFMTNAHIGEYDNAELVHRLATWGDRRRKAWIVTGQEFPGILVLVGRQGWMILCSAAALLAFWLWRHAWRFGPAQPLPAPQRRSVMEHVDASGRFLWRHGHGNALLADVQAAVRARAARRVADWQQLTDEERHRLLAESSGLSAAAVADALARSSPASRSDFVDLLRRLDTIDRAL